MRTVRMRTRTNDGLVAISRAHPDATFTIQGAWPVADGIRLLVETGDVGVDELRETIDAVETIRNPRSRAAVDEVARFEFTTPEPAAHGAMADSGVVPSFPQTVEDGWITGELTAGTDQVRTFLAELDAGDVAYRVDWVRDVARQPPLLTDRQREVVEVAAERGYYAYPRECTVTGVAEAVGVHKSVASRILMRAESRIVQSFLE